MLRIFIIFFPLTSLEKCYHFLFPLCDIKSEYFFFSVDKLVLSVRPCSSAQTKYFSLGQNQICWEQWKIFFKYFFFLFAFLSKSHLEHLLPSFEKYFLTMIFLCGILYTTSTKTSSLHTVSENECRTPS